jgi:hypothetical protein
MKEWIDKNVAIDKARTPAIDYFADILTKDSDIIYDKELFKKTLYWFFAVDDLFDNDKYHYTQERDKSRANMFDDILSSLQLEERPFEIFKEYLGRTLRGMYDESKNCDDFDKYMKSGKFTSGIPLIFGIQFLHHEELRGYTGFITLILEKAGEIVRLINDVATYDRELDEGKMNSVGIYMSAGIKYHHAVITLNHAIALKTREFESYMGKSETLNKYVTFLLIVIAELREFYNHHDFHTFKGEQ